jgi:8-oxo-dGTP pyrophosphatase MutT (NUDIX family)
MRKRRILQAAAIPEWDNRICLITSSSGKRWVIPKGCLEPGKSVRRIALQEAWEEAGLSGILQPHPVGSYLYEKWGETYHVTVFLMEVAEIADDWPERRFRLRRWMRPEKALARIADVGLYNVLRTAFERVESLSTFS